MTGTILNVAGILIGSGVGLARRKPLAPANESFLKVTLGAFMVFYGLRLTWISLNGPFLQIIKQLLVVILALMCGKITGRLLRFQQMSNALGRTAREHIAATPPGGSARVDAGFKTCATLFCAAPLGMLGAVQDGLSEYIAPLALKAVVDGLAAMGFVSLFGWGVMLAALPVLAVQGSISLVCAHFLKPFLENHSLVEPVNAAGGLLVFSVALVVLGLKRIELADYLPSLAFAALLGWLFR